MSLKYIIFWVLTLITFLVIIVIFSLTLGVAGIPAGKMVSVFLHGPGSTEYSIIFDIRLPRIILAFAVGGSLSLAGVLLQGMFRNSLVEPYTLGISGGAALGVSISIVLGLAAISRFTFPLFGSLGASMVIGILYLLSLKKVRINLQRLLLIGIMISFISSSLVMLLMSLSSMDSLHGIVFWIMGSLAESDGTLIQIMLAASLGLLAVSYLFCHHLNAFALGEEEAHHLGIPVESTKRILFLASSLLTGFCVSAAGMIGFVGLVVPHFMRRVVGHDHRILLVSSFLAGAIFLIVCDTVARIIIAPVELPVGVVTGIVGGSIFVYALAKEDIS
ncbi:MAG: iron ABC transporter permease [Candidatus Omnitrophica bacterium]|nr:iron ABC transporter permease [Candidatus Omnitrophota bacterium]